MRAMWVARNALAAALAAAALGAPAATRNLVWANLGSDLAVAGNWTDSSTGAAAAGAPTSEDRLFFVGRPGVQPVLSATLAVRAVCFGPIGSNGRTEADTGDGFGGFDHCGWTISGASGAELRITGSWTEGKNWNFAFSQASYGTNTVAVPVRFTNTGGNYRPVMPSHGRLVFAGAVASDSTTATILCNGTDGTVELAAANPELACAIQTDAACSLCFSHADALSAVTKLVLNDNTYPVRAAAFRNETGAPAVLASVTEITQTHNAAEMHFGGAAMSFPNAVFRQDSSRERRNFLLDVPVTVRSVGNASSAAGARLWRKDGPATLEVLEDVFADEPAGQTNRVQLLDGCLLLRDPSYYGLRCAVFGEKGWYFARDGKTSAIGLVGDFAVAKGDGPRGVISYRDQGYAAGFAAYGADRTVTFHGGGTYVMEAEDATLDGASGYVQQAPNLLFGAVDADATVTMSNAIDLNRASTHYSANSRSLYAVRGGAFVAGRIAGGISNSGAAGTLCRIQKYGDGALALDGDVACLPSSGDPNVVHAGGLLANAGFAGPVRVEDGAWLGGTGTLGPDAAVTVESGGALRPGELGGSLRTEGSVVFEDGAALAIDIGPDSCGCLAPTGTGQDIRAKGSLVLRLRPFGGLERGRTVKIVDLSGAATPDWTTLAVLPRYAFDLPEDGSIRNPVLSKDDTGVYLTFSVDSGRPLKVLFR